MDGWIYGQMDRSTDVQMEGWMDGWMDGWIDGSMDTLLDGWMVEKTN